MLNFKYLSVYSILDKKKLLSKANRKITSNETAKFEDEIQKLLRISDTFSKTSNEFQKIHSHNGTWYSSIDKQDLCYLILVNTDFPSSSQVRLINEFKSLVQNSPAYEGYEKNLYLDFDLSKELEILMNNYDNNPNYNDSFNKVQNQVDQICVQMENNVQDLYKNTHQLENIEDKTGEIANVAERFMSKATTLRRREECKQLTSTLFLYGGATLIITAIVLYLIC